MPDIRTRKKELISNKEGQKTPVLPSASLSSTKRLHISPFSPESLPIVLSGDLQSKGAKISFHNLKTFPERSYGYVDLPAKAADTLRRELNGCTIKGQKVSIEEAKSRRFPRSVDEAAAAHGPTCKPKHNRTADVTSAISLPESRKVKRGWTETDEEHKRLRRDRKAAKRSEHRKTRSEPSITGQSECLMKIKVPRNKAAHPGKRKRDRETTVHEYANTVRHAKFLRDTADTADSSACEYVDGVGWVDRSGQVVENDKKSSQQRRGAAQQTQKSPRQSPEPSQQDESPERIEKNAANLHDPEASAEREKLESTDEVHPLEAIFKKPRAPSQSDEPTEDGSRGPRLEVATSFSFFEVGNAENIVTMPQTPYTQRDFRLRGQRSAAPTPDTAAFGRTFADVMERDHEDATLSSQRDTSPLAPSSVADTAAESDFAKTFWENRGAYNREWKRQRREAIKEQKLQQRKIKRGEAS